MNIMLKFASFTNIIQKVVEYSFESLFYDIHKFTLKDNECKLYKLLKY